MLTRTNESNIVRWGIVIQGAQPINNARGNWEIAQHLMQFGLGRREDFPESMNIETAIPRPWIMRMRENA